MAKKKQSDGVELPSDDYDVGYGRPPAEHRFRPGQSGNRKGRPKGTKNLKTELQVALSERVSVRKGDGRRKNMPAVAAIVHVNLQKALAGDQAAARTIFGLLDKIGLPDPPEGNGPDLSLGNVEEKLERYIRWRLGGTPATGEDTSDPEGG